MAAVSLEAKRHKAEYRKLWNERNKERNAEYQRAWYQKNKERLKVLSREWVKNNREKKQASVNKWHSENKQKLSAARKLKYDPLTASKIWRSYQYGLSEDQFNLMLIEQKNSCAVCNDQFSDTNKPYVDHCHKTDLVRGLVCSKCNKAEGFLRTPENARKMYEYMLKFELCYGGRN